MKQLMITEPIIFRVQADQEKIVLSKLGNECGAIDPTLAGLDVRVTDHIEQSGTKAIQDRRFGHQPHRLRRLLQQHLGRQIVHNRAESAS